jgi:ABC-type sugar transport system permease subunit
VELFILVLAIIPKLVNVLFVTVNQVRKRVYLVIAQVGALAAVSLGLSLLVAWKNWFRSYWVAYTFAHFLVAVVIAWPFWKALKEEKVGGYTVL